MGHKYTQKKTWRSDGFESRTLSIKRGSAYHYTVAVLPSVGKYCYL